MTTTNFSVRRHFEQAAGRSEPTPVAVLGQRPQLLRSLAADPRGTAISVGLAGVGAVGVGVGAVGSAFFLTTGPVGALVLAPVLAAGAAAIGYGTKGAFDELVKASEHGATEAYAAVRHQDGRFEDQVAYTQRRLAQGNGLYEVTEK